MTPTGTSWHDDGHGSDWKGDGFEKMALQSATTWDGDGHKVCDTRTECNALRRKLGYQHFYTGDYQTKGCFEKNGNVFWGRGGTYEEKATSDLPGVQERRKFA